VKEPDFRQIQRNRKRFLNYNRLRVQHAYDLDPEKVSVALEIVPVLLTLNEVDLPGYVSGAEEGYGVFGVGSSYRLRRVIHDYFPEFRKRNVAYQKYLIKRPVVETLFTLGSIGTVGHTGKSDFDYWVCVDGTVASKKAMEELRLKTEAISHWCQVTFGMEVHFFVLDLAQIRRNDFGKVDEESVGSSQKKFLKEECYRTMLLVAGKIPFWWVVPPETDHESYETMWERLVREAPFDFVEYVDLGFLKRVSRDEFLGNALWQLGKGIKDPFKSILKMAMMDMYLSDAYGGPLLCEELKGRVLGGARTLRDMDPYLLVVEKVLDFYAKQGRESTMDLLRRAFYLKSDPKITRTKIKTSGGDYKVEVFKEMMESWGWSLDLVEELNQIRNWSFSRQQKFANEINQFFFSTYRSLSERVRLGEGQAIDQYDLTILGRRLMALFARRRDKLRYTPNLNGTRLVLERCVFEYSTDAQGRKRWTLYDASWYPAEEKRRQWRIFAAASVVKAAAWLVNNGLYEYPRTVVEMNPNSSGVILNDLVHLLKHLNTFIQPAFYPSSDPSALERAAVKAKILAVVDMEEVRKFHRPKTLDIVYKNSWGEMFVETHSFAEGLGILADYAEDLGESDPRKLMARIKVHLPESARDTHAANRVFYRIMRALPLKEVPPSRGGMNLFSFVHMPESAGRKLQRAGGLRQSDGGPVPERFH